MVEVHGWITIRETYEAIDEENIEKILQQIDMEIAKLSYYKPQIRRLNGECFFEILSYTNHRSRDVEELITFFKVVGELAKGSYGLLYVYDDEDKENNNVFVVHRLAKGRVDIYKDTYLSPIIPTIEDVDF